MRLPQKRITKSKNAPGANESAPPSSASRGQRVARICAEKLHLEISERNCSVSLRSQNAEPKERTLIELGFYTDRKNS